MLNHRIDVCEDCTKKVYGALDLLFQVGTFLKRSSVGEIDVVRVSVPQLLVQRLKFIWNPYKIFDKKSTAP